MTKEPLVTNQIEVHPFLDQTKVIEASRGYGMAITAYCPIARGRVPGNPVLERIGKAHGKTASQVSLRWLVQQGIIVIPGSGKPERQKENFDVLDFSLSPAEMSEIATLKKPDGRVVNPPQAPKWDVYEGADMQTDAKQTARKSRRIGLGTWQLNGDVGVAHHQAGAEARLPPSRLRADLRQREGGRRGAARLGREARGRLRHHQGAAHRTRARQSRARREAEPGEPARSRT